MPKTKLSKCRQSETKKMNIGKIILFCEGDTEKYYFDYFANIINGKNKYSEIHIEAEVAMGNSRTVLKYAEEFLALEDNNRKYATYSKGLVFDCDDPDDIQSVICDAISSNSKYELYISNYLFETWLLLHFENLTSKMGKSKIYEKLTEHLLVKYDKANTGLTRQLIKTGNIEKAIEAGYEMEKKYKG